MFLNQANLVHENNTIFCSGLLSIPDGYDSSLPHLKIVLEPVYGKLWVVHRLDKETSGIMLLARNAGAHRSLNASFRERKIKKTYHSLVTPVPNWREIQIRAHLRSLDLIHLGESLYNAGIPSPPISVQRLMLHARFLGFDHPSDGNWMSFAAPYPDDFRAAYAELLITTTRDVLI